MRLYIAGPMQGIPELNTPLFNAVAEELRVEGHEVKNPADNSPTDKAISEVTYQQHCDFIRGDIEWLLGVEGIVLLPGWENSSGANMELVVARALGLMVFEYDDEWPGSPKASAAVPNLYKLAATMQARARYEL